LDTPGAAVKSSSSLLNAPGDQAGAIAEVQRIGVADGVTGAIDYDKLRGVAAFARRLADSTSAPIRGLP
jgi:hypothetical protein